MLDDIRGESQDYSQANRIGRLITDLGQDKLALLRLTAVERLSEPFTVVVDCVSKLPQTVHQLLGTNVTVQFDGDEGYGHLERWFNGQVWEYSELERDRQGYHYRLVLRPDFLFRSLNRNNRIFQNKSVSEIALQLAPDNREVSLSGTYGPMEFCVQYQESDFAFLSRLLEYHGITYFHEHADGIHQLKLVDSRNGHPSAVPDTFPIRDRTEQVVGGCIHTLTERRGIGATQYVADDYDFTKPKTSISGKKSADPKQGKGPTRYERDDNPNNGAWAISTEVYDFPSKQLTTSDHENYAGLWLDADRRQMARSFAEGTAFAVSCGETITISLEEGDQEYLIVGATHRYSGPPYDSGEDGGEDFSVELELMPAELQYRPAMRTPRPRVFGPQTAIVVGPAGQELFTDKYGRVKVQFHWDREGKDDDNSSCYVRVAQSIAGNSWGSLFTPRIGQEVVVEFLDGDPDRPLITGAVYNGENMPPVTMPDKHTQMGLKTRSTLGGGGWNHYWYEDKKGEEVVWFRAERDYKANIVNADEERQYDEGNRQTTFKKGDDTLFINQGKRTETIEGDDTKTIKSGDQNVTLDKGGDYLTISQGERMVEIQQDDCLKVKQGNRLIAVKMGDDETTIDMGHQTTELGMGDHELTIKMGNQTTKIDLGKQSVEALQEINLKVGQSSVKIDQMGVTIEGMMIKINGQIMTQIKGGVMMQTEGGAMHTMKGGLVMIN